MPYFLVIAIAVSVVAVMYVWYVTRYLNGISDEQLLFLDGEEDKVMALWYESNIRENYNYPSEREIMQNYFRRMYGAEVNPFFLVAGMNLDLKYLSLTGEELPERQQGGDCITDLRSTLAIPGQIALISDGKIRGELQKTLPADLLMLDRVMSGNLDEFAQEKVREVLQVRWDLVAKMGDPSVVNEWGSFLYLSVDKRTSMGSKQLVMDTVVGKVTPRGVRLNMLCNNYEFEALMKRWKLSLLN